MKKYLGYIVLCGVLVMLITQLGTCNHKYIITDRLVDKAHTLDDIVSLFTITHDEITASSARYIQEALEIIERIISIPNQQRTYANTAQPIDHLFAISNAAVAHNVYHIFEVLHPDATMQKTAHDARMILEQFMIDHLSTNKPLYKAFIAYVHGNAQSEQLSDEQRYFLHDAQMNFQREGVALDDEIVVKLTTIKKEIADLCAEFERNIAHDQTVLYVTREQLSGLTHEFVDALKQSEDGLYMLGHDYPTYFAVMKNCSVEETRKNLYTLFNNRAYPANEAVLQTIIEKRNELALMLGYTDFAHFDLATQMVHDEAHARAFLDDIIAKARIKVEQECATLMAQLPASVTLTEDAKLKPWDFMYLENEYKKISCGIDERLISEYFPVQNTIKELLDIYRQFLSIEFEEKPINGLWSDDIIAITVLTKDRSEVLGTLLLDLYPRPNKYNHAAHATVITAHIAPNGKRIPDVSVVIANFPRATEQHPALLTRDFVSTFFHECGHALHAVLGATTIASLSGTATKTDFVELPSQMLEEWLTDKAIIKKISKHYLTGEQLPDGIIDAIINFKNAFMGYWVTRQAYLATLSLNYYRIGAEKNLAAIALEQYQTIMPDHIAVPNDYHQYASFGHLTQYGAKYYGYLWSKVFALDVFGEIKKHGLLDPVIGAWYVQEILEKGGAHDPNELLIAFLGRKPNSDAFFIDIGLSTP